MLIKVKQIVKWIIACIRMPYEILILLYVFLRLNDQKVLGENNSRNEIQFNLRLPVYYRNVIIEWKSENQLINQQGILNADKLTEIGGYQCTMRATLKVHYRYIKNSIIKINKKFAVTVCPQNKEFLIQKTLESLEDKIVMAGNKSLKNVYMSLNLVNYSKVGIPIAWGSSNESIVNLKGIVFCQDAKTEVTLTAKFKVAEQEISRKFQIGVSAKANSNGECSLIFVPHGDDELFLAINEIYTAVKRRESVWVCFYTNTDMIGVDYAEERYEQSVNALNYLGVEPEKLIFLGYSNKWKNKHIYLSDGDEVCESQIGLKQTYGVCGYEDFSKKFNVESHAYTRNNLKKDIKDVILMVGANRIYAIDMDGHIDHKAFSLIFDECIGEIIKENIGFFEGKKIYKGFAYNTNAYGKRDFLVSNVVFPTLEPKSNLGRTRLENPMYLWADRVCFQTDSDLLEKSLENPGMQSLLKYNRLFRSFESFINSDSVYWERHILSSFYNADIVVSSGDKKFLNDFKLMDVKDLISKSEKACIGEWNPEQNDAEKKIVYVFTEEIKISCLRIYQSFKMKKNIDKVTIIVDQEKHFMWRNYQRKKLPYIDIILENTKIENTIELYFGDNKIENLGITEIVAYAKGSTKEEFENKIEIDRKLKAEKYFWIYL